MRCCPSGSRAEIEAANRGAEAVRSRSAELRSARPFACASPPTASWCWPRSAASFSRSKTSALWEKNPDSYSSGATGAIFTIMSRSFAPPAERLKSAIAREQLIPRLFQSARENLNNPPRDLHRSRAGTTAGDRELLPERRAGGLSDRSPTRRCVAEFQQANQAVIDALQAYQTFLKNDLLPRSKGDFRIGAENYRKKLLYDEMVDTPLDRLLEIGYDDLRRNQARVQARGGRDRPQAHAAADPAGPGKRPSRAPTSCWNPSATCWAACATSSRQHHIVTIPSQVLPIVEETPPFMRALTTALHGYARAVRKSGQGSVLQRHAAGAELARQGGRGVHAGLQPRHHHQHRGSRGRTPATTCSFCG